MANRRSKTGSKARCNSVRLEEPFEDAIEIERGKLTKVEALLSCLMIAMEYEGDLHPPPHYPDVAQVACDLVKQAVDGLDSVSHERLRRRNQVKEDFVSLWGDGSSMLLMATRSDRGFWHSRYVYPGSKPT